MDAVKAKVQGVPDKLAPFLIYGMLHDPRFVDNASKVVITGPAGCGKTWLLNYFATVLEDNGITVVKLDHNHLGMNVSMHPSYSNSAGKSKVVIMDNVPYYDKKIMAVLYRGFEDWTAVFSSQAEAIDPFKADVVIYPQFNISSSFRGMM